MCKLYVSTYAKYNSGNLAGAWVDLEEFTDVEEFNEAIRKLHEDEEDPEFMFQDFEGFPKAFYRESGLVEGFWDWLALDQEERERVEAFIDCFGMGGDMEDTIQAAEDAFYGQYDSDVEFAECYVDSSGLLSGVPDNLQSYFDYSAFARDLMFDFSSSNGFYFSDNW